MNDIKYDTDVYSTEKCISFVSAVENKIVVANTRIAGPKPQVDVARLFVYVCVYNTKERRREENKAMFSDACRFAICHFKMHLLTGSILFLACFFALCMRFASFYGCRFFFPLLVEVLFAFTHTNRSIGFYRLMVISSSNIICPNCDSVSRMHPCH